MLSAAKIQINWHIWERKTILKLLKPHDINNLLKYFLHSFLNLSSIKADFFQKLYLL